jgi:hypothetical protein
MAGGSTPKEEEANGEEERSQNIEGAGGNGSGHRHATSTDSTVFNVPKALGESH